MYFCSSEKDPSLTVQLKKVLEVRRECTNSLTLMTSVSQVCFYFAEWYTVATLRKRGKGQVP